MVESIREHGGKVTCIAAKNNIQLIAKAGAIADYVKKNRIDLIHAHLPWAGIAARIAGRLNGVPVIYTEHNKQERYHRATRFMNLFTMNWQKRVIAVSEDVEESVRKFKPGIRARLQTVLNGVNTDRFKPGMSPAEVRTALNIPADAKVIGTIAVFRFQKRLDLWVALAAKILKSVPDAHFVLVGDGPLKAKVVEAVKAHHLEERIHFAGVQTEVRPYIAAFDIYMMTSIFEGLPIALLEAMASGCPVISTDAGGIKEVIRHEHDGLLCSIEKPEALVEYATRLFTNREERIRLGQEGRKRIEDSFSMTTMVRQLEDIYRKEASDAGYR